MSRIRAITSGDSRARLRLAKPLRFAPTPRGAHGLDEDLGAPRMGTYVMTRALRRREALMPSQINHGDGKEESVKPENETPSIAVRIGRLTRVYHPFVTTAPEALDTPATLTLYAATVSDVVGMAADPDTMHTARASSPARLVLVDATELAWQRRRCREGKHRFTPADPILVGLNTLQHWLWRRLESRIDTLESAGATA